MIVVTSRIRVTSGNAAALADQYRSRLHRAEAVEGCLGVEVLRNLERPDEFVVVTRWRTQADYDAYRAHPAFREAHARIRDIPGGLRVAREDRALDRWEVLS